MPEPEIKGAIAKDVPAQVFENFLAALAQAEVPAGLIARLRRSLLEDKELTERALAAALFAEEEEP